MRSSTATERLPRSRRAPTRQETFESRASVAWTRLAPELSSAWGVSRLEERVRVEISYRLTASLGRCFAAKGVIRIAAFLVDGPHSLLREVLGHEAAHVAVHILYGDRRRPHGPEWSSLMRKAGLEPRRRVPADELRAGGGPTNLPQRPSWEHRCPVCQVRRHAARPISRWRCAACRAAGLEGELVIRKVDRQQVRIG